MSTGISAMVVGRNEADKLTACLPSLAFCDEILYADLNSHDSSIQVASEFNCKIFKYEKFGPAGEYTHAELVKFVKNDWVIILDPDEVISLELQMQILSELPEWMESNDIADIYVPWQFYFNKKKLQGTVWGHNKFKAILFNRKRYEILPITHYGRRKLKGFRSIYIQSTKKNVLHHYWMSDYSTFLSKHSRYLKDEGRDKFNLGQKISVVAIIYNVFYQFINSYVKCRGYKDGFIGLFLSLFWTYYCTYANISLFLIAFSDKKLR